jgi:putative ABC transport system permease protein
VCSSDLVHIAQYNYFDGKYKDNRAENYFMKFGTDPGEIFDVYTDWKIDPEQLKAWQRDPAGAVVDSGLASRLKLKLGDRVLLTGSFYGVDTDLTIRGIYEAPPGNSGLLFNFRYIEDAQRWAVSQVGIFIARVDSAESVQRVSRAIDDMFRNAPQPTKTETEKGFQLDFIAMMGNVKAFILSISTAVVFAILLVAANTVAMSIRERTREVAVLKTLGFSRGEILGLFVGEAVLMSTCGGTIGVLACIELVRIVASSPAGLILEGITVTPPTLAVAIVVAAMLGFVSGFLPAWRASRLQIAEGLRHVG